jgi:hypothetical protein
MSVQVILRLDPGGLDQKVVDEVLRDRLAQLAVTLDLELVIVDHVVRNDLLPAQEAAREELEARVRRYLVQRGVRLHDDVIEGLVQLYFETGVPS